MGVRHAERSLHLEKRLFPFAAPHHMKPPQNPFAISKIQLTYTSDNKPGITRIRRKEGFVYRNPDGKPIKDPATLGRIKSLAIPPAWEHVWICIRANGHLQATGRDARGRKQYRYHPEWREERDGNKYGRLLSFARALPKVRSRVAKDLLLHGMPREKVLAAVVRLLETSLIRIGNSDYAKQNQSYGLTTLLNRHAKVKGSNIQFQFKGKSGIEHDIQLADKQLAKIIRTCQELPGQELFCYVDEAGESHDVTSQDVNAYLKETTGEDFTAKDFRTWAGTVLCAQALDMLSPDPEGSMSAMKRAITDAIRGVAKALGNTLAVCRKCYIHPAVVGSYQAGETLRSLAARKKISPHLRREEAAVVVLLTLKTGA